VLESSPAKSAPVPVRASSQPSASAISSSVTELPLPPDLIERRWPLAPDCKDPRVLLAVRYPSDPTRHLWLKQLLGVYPEFRYQGHLASKAPEGSRGPGAIWVYETAYGPKRFAQSRSFEQPDFYKVGLLARCGDMRTCEKLGTLYSAIDPRASVDFFCGVPPATSGGEGGVPLLETSAAVSPKLAEFEENSCARIRTCQTRLGQPRIECLRHAVADLQRCAAASLCDEVQRCATSLATISPRPSPVREAQPRAPGSRPRVEPGKTREDLF
jgi:hypothetical protein